MPTGDPVKGVRDEPVTGNEKCGWLDYGVITFAVKLG
jgi:hypothetical protein